MLGHSLTAGWETQILLSPSAWAVPAEHDPTVEPYGSLWEGSYRTLASLYAMPVLGVSNVGWVTGGPWAGRKCIGCSLAVGPRGEILAKGPYGVDAEKLIVVDVDLRRKGVVTGTDITSMLRGKGYRGRSSNITRRRHIRSFSLGRVFPISVYSPPLAWRLSYLPSTQSGQDTSIK